MNTTRDIITTAALLACAVIAPASVLMGGAYLVSRSEAISSAIFFGTLLADLIGVYWWASQRMAPAGQRARISVHEFVACMKMHPELMPPGMTEFDLECFRTLQRQGRQPGLDAWFRQFAGATTTHPSSQLR